MSPGYRIEWSPSAKRDLRRLPEKVASAVVEFIYGALADNPRRLGRDLHLELTGYHAARRGDFRIVYRIDDRDGTIAIATINSRADVYRRR
jgi:mRNA interferase RelE/StbE